MSNAIECRRCKYASPAPAEFDAVARAEFAAHVRTHHAIDAIRGVRVKYGYSLTDAKFLMQHVTKVEGTCHWCKGAIGAGAEVDCPKCGSLNLQW